MPEFAVYSMCTWDDRGQDEAFLIKSAVHNPEAFDKLYDRYYPIVANYIYRRVGNVHDTEDLISEVFFRVLRSLPRYRWRHIPFSSWVYRIATNVVNDWLKSRKRRHIQNLPEPDEIAYGKKSSVPDESKNAIRQAVLSLRAKHQNVIALYYFEGLSIEMIAVILGCREGTVKSRLSRARTILRDVLSKELEV